MEFGSEEQKQFFLPKILAGELHFSIGYTEPNAGTDLASLTTRAVKDGDEWVINGQKIYTSLASYADYIWLAARTDPDAPKHAGHHDLPRAHVGSRVLVLEDRDDGERQHLQHLLRQRAGGRRRHRRRRQQGLAPHHQPAQLRAGLARPSRDGRAGVRRGAPLDPGHQAPRRPPRRRPGVGAAQPGPGPRQARVRQAHQLEGRRRRRRQPGRRQRHQGLRHRVLHGGLPAPDGDPRPQRLPAGLGGARARRAGSSAPSRAPSSSPSAAA